MLTDSILKDFKTILAKEDCKVTQPRIDILSFIMDMDSHMSCDQIFDNLKDSGKDVSKATLYRTLDILVRHEFARKMDIGDGVIRYEKKIGIPHHDHMICIETGDIVEFYDGDIERIQDNIAHRHGYEVVKHVHQLFVKPIKGKSKDS